MIWIGIIIGIIITLAFSYLIGSITEDARYLRDEDVKNTRFYLDILKKQKVNE